MFSQSISSSAMEKAYAGLWQRMRVTSNNITNEDTPGYKAKRVAFEDVLARQVRAAERGTLSRRDSLRGIQSVPIREYELQGLEGRADGNNVDIDSEHIEMARIQLQYNALERKISGHYSNLKYVITGGR